MAKISVKNKFFSLPMIVPVMGIISAIVSEILHNLWFEGKFDFSRDFMQSVMSAGAYFLVLNVILIFISVGFAISKTIRISEFAINLSISILSFLTIAVLMGSKM